MYSGNDISEYYCSIRYLTSMSEWCPPLIKMKEEWRVSPEKSIWIFYWWEKWIGEGNARR